MFRKVLVVAVAIVLPLAMNVGQAKAASGRISFDPGAITVFEGSSQTVSLLLDSPITAPLADTASLDITLTSSDPARVSVSPNTLHYSAADWSQAKSITIGSVDDGIYNDGATVTITLAATSNAQYYSGFSTSLPVTLLDIDPAPAGSTVPNQSAGQGSSGAFDDQPLSKSETATAAATSSPKRRPMVIEPADVATSIGAKTGSTSSAGSAAATPLVISARQTSDKVAAISISVLAILVLPLAAILLLPRGHRLWRAVANRLRRLPLMQLASRQPMAIPASATVAPSTQVAEASEPPIADTAGPTAAKAKKPRKTSKSSATPTKSSKKSKKNQQPIMGTQPEPAA